SPHNTLHAGPHRAFNQEYRAGIYCKRCSMHAKQISPDKNVNCHYTTAAFTLSPESKGFVMLC
ncbi:MAG: hypothetical protein KAQ72_08635, partial [Desulfobacula sp.]|nr:hypothetical protein [Desulfobacula sp.]